MVYRGQVLGNVIVLADGVLLPDGSDVLVEPILRASPVPALGIPTRNGVPIFPSSGNGLEPGLAVVNELRDDAP